MTIGIVIGMRINPEALAAIRQRSGMTQTDLAERANISQSRLSELESKSLNVRPGSAKRLAEALLVPVTAIISASPEAVAS